VTDSHDGDDLVIGCVGKSLGMRSHTYGVVRAHKPEGQANLAFIVRACNSHYELLEALEQLHLKAVVGTDDERHSALNAAWAAISKARGQ
jgi:hypothetical protein